MTPSKSWGLLAMMPLSCGILLRLSMSDHLRWLVRCRSAFPNLISYGTIVLSLLALAVTFTFATAAAQNRELEPVKRVIWVLALVLFSPILAPLYWWFHIRGRK
jgi:hypothetical protein